MTRRVPSFALSCNGVDPGTTQCVKGVCESKDAERTSRILFQPRDSDASCCWDGGQVRTCVLTGADPVVSRRKVPVFMSLQIWVVISSLFVFTENSWTSPSQVPLLVGLASDVPKQCTVDSAAQAFFASVPSSMYWTSSFLIGR